MTAVVGTEQDDVSIEYLQVCAEVRSGRADDHAPLPAAKSSLFGGAAPASPAPSNGAFGGGLASPAQAAPAFSFGGASATPVGAALAPPAFNIICRSFCDTCTSRSFTSLVI